jgi:hypothetical protein
MAAPKAAATIHRRDGRRTGTRSPTSRLRTNHATVSRTARSSGSLFQSLHRNAKAAASRIAVS